MSNGDTRVDVSSQGTYHLGLALDLAMVYHTGPVSGLGEKALSHWSEVEGKLVFSWHASGGGNALLVPHTRDMLIPLITGWLEKQEYPQEPDTDGTARKGWRVLSHWSKMPSTNGRSYYQFTVEPYWMVYGK